METLAERIADKNKTAFYVPFIEALRTIALNESKTEDEVYWLWKKYAKQCDGYDQSALLDEFCRWNNFTGGNYDRD